MLFPIRVICVPVYFFAGLVEAEELVEAHGDAYLVVGAGDVEVGAAVVYLEFGEVDAYAEGEACEAGLGGEGQFAAVEVVVGCGDSDALGEGELCAEDEVAEEYISEVGTFIGHSIGDAEGVGAGEVGGVVVAYIPLVEVVYGGEEAQRQVLEFFGDAELQVEGHGLGGVAGGIFFEHHAHVLGGSAYVYK